MNMNALHRWYCGSGLWRRHLQGDVLPRVVDGVPIDGEVLEIGPGRGLSTEWLAARNPRVTVVELDQQLAVGLRQRFTGDQVAVVRGSGAQLPFPDKTFGTVVCTTMLHHVPTPGLQDQLLADVRRVLRPGGWFIGSDSRAGLLFSLAHIGDVLTLVEPDGFAARLAAVGFTEPAIELGRGFFTFRAQR